jgi:hypothetical protein
MISAKKVRADEIKSNLILLVLRKKPAGKKANSEPNEQRINPF